MSLTIRPNDQITLDPSDEQVVQWDWTDRVVATAAISTSTFTVTAIKQNGGTTVTLDSASILVSNRVTQIRIKATTATAGDQCWINNKIVTNEGPAQTWERRIKVLVQNQ